MSEFALTAQRRDELAALLDDEQKFVAEYPTVADYLRTVPMLTGTDDEATDNAFDLRMLHYLTGGESNSGNPYWDIVGPAVTDRGSRSTVDAGNPSGSSRLAYAQAILQAAFAYAIPSPETLEWITQRCADKPIVELGAGRGYWAHQLACSGAEISAYDSEPPTEHRNVSFPATSGQPDTWHPVHSLPATHPGSGQVLFLCWPPGWGNPMASTALAEFEQAGGRDLLYIGEPKGGKTGDDAFFDSLSARWQLDDQCDRFVSWWNLTDTAQWWTFTG